ncbi:uncharacterized protein LOC134093504 [Sardina pilchardus]|uniref:uncharacterized protein LOC134093504 n=1 Tax=Sardina pilchardus TaxID=27697 RepID=UPI002E15443D
MSRSPEPPQQQPMPAKKEIKAEECYEFLQKVEVEETAGLEHGGKTEILTFQTFIVKEEKLSPVRVKEEEEESNLWEYGHCNSSPSGHEVEERPELEHEWTTEMATSAQLTCEEETYCAAEIKEEIKEEDCHEDMSITIQEEKPGIELDWNTTTAPDTSPQLSCGEENEEDTSPQLSCGEENEEDTSPLLSCREEAEEDTYAPVEGPDLSPGNTRRDIDIDCDPAPEPKAWSILDSFMAFGSDDLFCSTPDATLDALVPFPRIARATAPLSSSAPPGGLAPTAPEMRDPCGQKCRRQCTGKFSEGRRREIWSSYWLMDNAEKRLFVFHSVSQLPTARCSVAGSRRGRSFVYRLENEDQVPQQVCKTFYLATLGYHPTNDSLVLSVMGREMGNKMNLQDRRGRHPPANKLDLQPVFDHIESFHPSVGHDGREQSPRHRRYLPRDVTIKLMYADYVEKGNRCSYETYRKAVKQKNIGFCKARKRGDARSGHWP